MLVIRHKTKPAKEQGQYIKVKRIQDQEIDFLRKEALPDRLDRDRETLFYYDCPFPAARAGEEA